MLTIRMVANVWIPVSVRLDSKLSIASRNQIEDSAWATSNACNEMQACSIANTDSVDG